MGIGFLLILAVVFWIIWRKKQSSTESQRKRPTTFDRKITNTIKGRCGELRVEFALGSTILGEKYVINNLCLNVGENKTCQIDHVLINRNGVFVIETKNYSGRIYGNENQREWTQVLGYGNVKNKFYNPIKQNSTHIYHISQILTDKLPIISAVVFIKANTEFIEANGVYSVSELKRLINQPHGNLSIQQIEKAYAQLMDAHDPFISKNEHIENIHSMQSNIVNNICPRCGKTYFEKREIR